MSSKSLKEKPDQLKKSLQPSRSTISISYDISNRAKQGDFYSDITIIDSITENLEDISVTETYYPLCILLNQDCDLNSDKRDRESFENYLKNVSNDPNLKIPNQDKKLLWLLFVPVYVFDDFKLGNHLSEIDKMRMSQVDDKSLLNKITQNEIPRFHYLKFEEKEKISDMVIDFKHFFTISSDLFFSKYWKNNFKYSTKPLFRENISQRFANYLARIGLPDLN